MKICVTEEDIKKGRPLMGGVACPITLAIRRAGLNVARCSPSGATTMIGDKETRIANMPISALEFMYDFDMGLAVQPFEFELEVS